MTWKVASEGAPECNPEFPRADVALVIGPTFGEYAHASKLARAQLVEWPARDDEHFARGAIEVLGGHRSRPSDRAALRRAGLKNPIAFLGFSSHLIR